MELRTLLIVLAGFAIGFMMLIMVGIVAALPWIHLLQGIL